MPERAQGGIQFRGPSATQRLLPQPRSTARLLVATATGSTGDLGYIADGELYITGRSKDIIIRAGRNLYPHELEEAVGEIPGVRKGCVAVFASCPPTTPSGHREGRSAWWWWRRRAPSTRRRATRCGQRIASAASELVGSAADEVVLVPPAARCRRPRAARSAVAPPASSTSAASSTPPPGPSGGSSCASPPPASGRGCGACGGAPASSAWAGWAWLLLALVAPPAWLLVVALPGRAARRRAARATARLLATGCGIPLRASGLASLPSGACVVACNHQSYVDAFVVSALLPPRFAFVVKSELARSFLTRLPLARLGALFVERFDAERGAEDAGRAVGAVAAGESLVVFPEGTFQRAPGLLPFRLGAFAAAARAGAPVVPLALRGTRSLLRGEQWLPRRGVVTATFGAPIAPAGATWSDALALRDATRAWMLAHLGEPDLAA